MTDAEKVLKKLRTRLQSLVAGIEHRMSARPIPWLVLQPVHVVLERADLFVAGVVRRVNELRTEQTEAKRDPEQLIAEVKRIEQAGRRAARTRWYQRRPVPIEVPESLRYYEAVHGTRATLEMLRNAGRKIEERGD